MELTIIGNRCLCKLIPTNEGIRDAFTTDDTLSVCAAAEIIAISEKCSGQVRADVGDAILFAPFRANQIKRDEFLVSSDEVLMVGTKLNMLEFLNENTP